MHSQQFPWIFLYKIDCAIPPVRFYNCFKLYFVRFSISILPSFVRFSNPQGFGGAPPAPPVQHMALAVKLQFVVFHGYYLISAQRYVQRHHDTESNGKGKRSKVGMFALRHFRD